MLLTEWRLRSGRGRGGTQRRRRGRRWAHDGWLGTRTRRQRRRRRTRLGGGHGLRVTPLRRRRRRRLLLLLLLRGTLRTGREVWRRATDGLAATSSTRHVADARWLPGRSRNRWRRSAGQRSAGDRGAAHRSAGHRSRQRDARWQRRGRRSRKRCAAGARTVGRCAAERVGPRGLDLLVLERSWLTIDLEATKIKRLGRRIRRWGEHNAQADP